MLQGWTGKHTCGVLMLWMGLVALAPARDVVDRRGEMESADAFATAAHKTYRFQPFSDRYSATLEIQDNDEVFRPGIIRIQRTGDGAPMVEIRSDELVLDTTDGQARTNVHELPYGEQSLIVADDFNFDGRPDLAVMDGQFGCYHGPSYQVYLDTATGLEHDDALTTLAQENCGLFQVDHDARTLSTMTKDGCCWHAFSVYGFVGGTLTEIKHTEEDARGDAPGVLSSSGWETRNGKQIAFSRRTWVGDQDDQLTVLMSFQLAPSGKRVLLYADKGGGPLYYASLQGDEIALLYPQGEEAGGFAYDAAADRLAFQRGDTGYAVVGPKGPGGLHMEVTARGKRSTLKVEAGSLQGSLTALPQAKLENLETTGR